MDSPVSPLSDLLPVARVVPSWATSRKVGIGEADAAFAAGAALNVMDDVVRSAPAWSGCWRARLALKCSASAVRLAGRSEDEAALRDALLMSAAGSDPGPAGNILVAWRRLATETAPLGTEIIRDIAELMALRWDDQLAAVVDLADNALQSGRAAPFSVAALIAEVYRVRPDAEILAWWMADRVLAEKLRWRLPVPLLMAERYGAPFRTTKGRGRLHPGDGAFPTAICMALVDGASNALAMAHEIDRKADRLASVAPKVRTKGAGSVIHKLLNDDAVLVSAPGSGLSRWASRRFFERLETYEAIRELSGRQNFRIYGL